MKKKTEPVRTIDRVLPPLLCALFAGFFLFSFRPPANPSRMDINGFSELPVLNGGRVKPLDSIARSSLLALSGKQTLVFKGRTKSAADWLADVIFAPETTYDYAHFRIDDPDVLGMMGLQQSAKRLYSFRDLESHLSEVAQQATRVSALEADRRTRFEASILNLTNQLILYRKLQLTLQADKNEAEFFPIPPVTNTSNPDSWTSIGHSVNTSPGKNPNPAVGAYLMLADAYRASDAALFNQMLAQYRIWLRQTQGRILTRVSAEVLFNRVQPFYRSLVMYVAVFLLSVLSWLVWPKTLERAAFALLVLAFFIHTGGLVSRMILQGRPPVTNLYSSAIFVGWMAVLLGIALEWLFRKGIGSAVASAIGFITLIIAHHLAAQGDTLEMMRAVLDSNFWLATHVVCITIGYSSTFLSGSLGLLYLVRRAFDPKWSKESAVVLERMVYGVVCFSTFFSFLGTILGGIWADQSWGRFWGWDPKENGALMIVLWNVFILHARWGKLARQKTVMMLAVGGNIVTALSWFGVNMLGIGLHSYGFMDKAFYWLMFFTASQLAFIGIGFLPERHAR